MRAPGRRRLRAGAAVLASIVAVAGIAILGGWRWNVVVLKSLLPGLITIKANTATAFVSLALAVLVLLREPATTLRRMSGVVLVAIPAAIAALTLGEYLLGRSFGIDELLFPDPEGRIGGFPPGRLAPITAVNFLLLGAAVVLALVKRRPAWRTAHVATLLAFVAGFQGFVGYVLGTTYTFGLAFYTQMAVHTTVLFVLLCAAVFLARPEHGLMEIATSPTAGGRLARSLVLAAIAVPPVVGWLAQRGERRGLYDANFTTLLRVVGNSFFFSILVWRNAAALHRLDLARDAAERAQARSTDELRSALRARDEFLTTASHWLKTPLTPLRIQLSKLRGAARAQPPDAPLARAVLDATEKSERQVERLVTLVNELLDVAALSAASLRPEIGAVEVGPWLEACVRGAAEALAAAGCRVTVGASADVAVRGDRRLLDEALRLLLLNAAMHAPGTDVSVTARDAGDVVVVEVADRGPGIAVADQARIFERYERAVADADKAPGFGVGLYVAREIARVHGGSLSVESAPGRGARFSFAVPRQA